MIRSEFSNLLSHNLSTVLASHCTYSIFLLWGKVLLFDAWLVFLLFLRVRITNVFDSDHRSINACPINPVPPAIIIFLFLMITVYFKISENIEILAKTHLTLSFIHINFLLKKLQHCIKENVLFCFYKHIQGTVCLFA